MSIGVQFSILALLYSVLPDWPAKNAGTGVTYFGILYTMAKYAVTEPVLIQAGLMQFAASACFSNFWVTLTFLLGGPPYNYSTSAALPYTYFLHLPIEVDTITPGSTLVYSAS